MQRLLGFERVMFKPGEARTLTMTADPRLLARYDEAAKAWRIDCGRYAVAVSDAADQPVVTRDVTLKARTFGK
jgi:beta-glucosidase